VAGASPDPWLVFREPLRGKRMRREEIGGEGREGGKGKGEGAFPFSFLQFNHCVVSPLQQRNVHTII